MDLIKTLLLKLRLGKKAEPLIVLGKKLSNNNNVVVKSLELYWFSPEAYFDDITPVDALVRALSSANAVVCVDNRSEPLLVLPLLQKLVPIRFEKANEGKSKPTRIKS